jgi:predicted adenine nucleotide alpha hydrolase (AANH) superfamily ATPase
MNDPSETPGPLRLLLHACCGPCLLEPLDALSAEADHVAIIFANPNIHPAEEYERRRDTLRAYAEPLGVEIVELEYDPAAWFASVGPLAKEGAARCRACYALRLGQAATYAAEHGFDALATTLSVSPYQDAEAICEEGERAAAAAGVRYLHRDFRERYPDATRRSRELGMYRQNYCGCVLSDGEAREERAARRAARAAAKSGKDPGGAEDAPVSTDSARG